MARIKKLEVKELNEHQLRLATEIGGTRGGGPAVNGPWGLLLRNPALCERGAAFGTMLRDATSAPKRLSEIAIAVVARHWTAQFEWQAHARAAEQAGLDAAIIRDIAEGRRPSKLTAEEAVVYNFTTELLTTHQVSDPTYAAAKAQLGERGVVDLIGLMGWYQMVSMLLNVDRYPLPDGAPPPLKALP